MSIDLSEYTLIRPTSIKYVNDNIKTYDIEVKDTNTFFVVLNENDAILSHNCDGIGHIASLVINLFYKWFPQVIDSGKLNILITPLASADIGKERKYFYSLSEIGEFEKSKTAHKNMRYLKGLGSLAIQDWELIMKERKMFKLKIDRSAAKYIDIAFGPSAGKRKQWLEGVI